MRWIFVRNAVIAEKAVKRNISPRNSPHFLQKFTASTLWQNNVGNAVNAVKKKQFTTFALKLLLNLI